MSNGSVCGFPAAGKPRYGLSRVTGLSTRCRVTRWVCRPSVCTQLREDGEASIAVNPSAETARDFGAAAGKWKPDPTLSKREIGDGGIFCSKNETGRGKWQVGRTTAVPLLATGVGVNTT